MCFFYPCTFSGFSLDFTYVLNNDKIETHCHCRLMRRNGKQAKENKQLYRGSQFYWWMKPEYPGKNPQICHKSFDKLYHIRLIRHIYIIEIPHQSIIIIHIHSDK
jgi:hypothetical protein